VRKNEVIVFRLTSEQKDAIRERARKHGMTMTELLLSSALQEAQRTAKGSAA